MAYKVPTSGQDRRKEYYRRKAVERSAKYDNQWANFSKNYRKSHPFCVECLKLGIHNTSHLQVDHIIPLEKRPDLKYEDTNLQVLCRRPWCRGYFSFMSFKENL
ncbi:HNH endonuclease signature motif containing protein [Acetobacter pasteurianus]|uniref:HNH endonuclease signature motif containing protein n=1 Tax=Acetobacter pasteurianus TaxID=438 RepID=UPI000B3EB008